MVNIASTQSSLNVWVKNLWNYWFIILCVSKLYLCLSVCLSLFASVPLSLSLSGVGERTMSALLSGENRTKNDGFCRNLPSLCKGAGIWEVLTAMFIKIFMLHQFFYCKHTAKIYEDLLDFLWLLCIADRRDIRWRKSI